MLSELLYFLQFIRIGDTVGLDLLELAALALGH